MYVSAGINKLIYYSGVYKNKEVTEKLIKFTRSKHKHAYIRSCADAFGRTKDPRCVKPLCESLTWVKEGPELRSVISALQKLKSKDAIEPLSKLVIKREPIAKMRNDCVEKLKNI
jgi:HEAT repeat protein